MNILHIIHKLASPASQLRMKSNRVRTELIELKELVVHVQLVEQAFHLHRQATGQLSAAEIR